MVRSVNRARLRLAAATLAVAIAPVGSWLAPATAAPPGSDAPAANAEAAPVPFALPLDAGTRAVADLARARAELPAAEAAADLARRQLTDLDDRWARLQYALAQAQEAERTAAAEVEDGRDRVREVAVRAYVHGSEDRVVAAFRSFDSAGNLVDLSRDLRVIERVGSERTRDLARRRERHEAARQRVAELLASRGDLAHRRDQAGERLAGAIVAVHDAAARIDDATARIEQFHRAATASSSPLLGPSRLSAGELAAFVVRSGHEPRATVPIHDLAAMFLEEGAAEGVRGDVAFAQSILETGWFTFPDGGMVRPGDNNFAGVGACDTCERGYTFPSARAGVRAQIQLLRTYADAEVDAGTFAHAALLPGALGLGFRGDVRTWWDLGGRWATGPGYGDRVYAIYRQMVGEAGSP